MGQKSFKIDLLKSFKKFQADFQFMKRKMVSYSNYELGPSVKGN